MLDERGAAFTSIECNQYCEVENIQIVHITTGVPVLRQFLETKISPKRQALFFQQIH